MGGWQIVKYPEDSNLVEAVPSSWIYKSKDSTGFLCWWPNCISRSKIAYAIKSQQVPAPDWKSYPTVILSRTIYDDFATATKKATQAKYTSGIDSDLDNYASDKEPSQKRTKKKNPRYLSSSEDDEIVSSPIAKIRRSPRFKLPTPPKVLETYSQISDSAGNTIKKLPVVSAAAENSPLTPYSLGFQSSSNSFSKSKPQAIIVNVRSNLTSKLCEVGQPTSSSHIQLFDTKKSFAEVINLLHIINGRVAQNTELLTTMATAQNSKPAEIEQLCDKIDILENLPIKSAQELIIFDSELDDTNVKSVLVKKLSYAGGSNLKDVIKRLFPIVVVDEVLKEFSWIGAKGKKKFSTLINLCKIIKDAVKANPSTKLSNEKSVEEVISIFLSKATERCTRKMAKAVHCQNQDE